MKNKYFLIVVLSSCLVFGMSFISLAAEWIQDTKGWWYQEEDGSYPSNTWKEIEGKQYYFDSDGYMLSNTTTPDGYKVGADGAWIKEKASNKNNQFIENKNYYEKSFSLFGAFVTDSNVYYTLSKLEKSSVTLYCANIDGSNAIAIVDNIGGAVVRGVDNKFYYGDSSDGTLRRCNLDGSGMEILYQSASKTMEVPNVDANGNYLGGTRLYTYYDVHGIGIEFANGSGIQTSEGFFDIASNQFIVGKKEKEQVKEQLDSKEPSSTIKAIIPDKNYKKIVQLQEVGDYVRVVTYVDNPSSFYFSEKLNGSYIINTKTNTCVYHTKDVIGTLQVTELGLLAERSGSLYRIEDGGGITNIMEDGATGYIVKHGRIYYKKDSYNFAIIDTLAPAALPTSKVV